MPEQLTKHPDVTLQVLRSAGAQCGSGAEQSILQDCPAERFCKLPGGELCVYGLADASRMTQLSPSDWQSLTQAAGAGPADRIGTEFAVLGVALLLLGVLLGWGLRRRR